MSVSPTEEPVPARDPHALSGVAVPSGPRDEDELDPDEPRTPAWMPLLGGILFLAGALAFAATRPPGKTAEQLSEEAEAAAAAAQAAKAPPPAPAPAPQPAQPAQAPRRGG